MAIAVAEDPAQLDLLLARVHRHGGYDFRGYRRGTVTRRLERRLQATGAGTYLAYADYLDGHPEEYHHLADALTIKVSGFFRSPYTCQKLTGLVLPELLRRKEAAGQRELRIWSTACARGEEPYTAAMLLADFLGHRRDFSVSILATDISRRALDEAPDGVYSITDVEGLPPGVLQRYFVRHHQGYQLCDGIRHMVSFARFDLTSSAPPPLAGPDCIFCCNVLIYFQRPLQERVLNMLYDALGTPGYLILGEVETPTGSLSGKLECCDSKARIYRKVTI